MTDMTSEGDELSPGVMIIDAHEELVQHIEDGQAKIRALALLTIPVAVLILVSYILQFILPITSGLLDTSLILLRAVVIIALGAWICVGVINYRFYARANRQIMEIRAAEKVLEKRIMG